MEALCWRIGDRWRQGLSSRDLVGWAGGKLGGWADWRPG